MPLTSLLICPIGRNVTIVNKVVIAKGKMAEVGPPDCETQKLQIGNLMKQPLKKGDTW